MDAKQAAARAAALAASSAGPSAAELKVVLLSCRPLLSIAQTSTCKYKTLLLRQVLGFF